MLSETSGYSAVNSAITGASSGGIATAAFKPQLPTRHRLQRLCNPVRFVRVRKNVQAPLVVRSADFRSD